MPDDLISSLTWTKACCTQTTWSYDQHQQIPFSQRTWYHCQNKQTLALLQMTYFHHQQEKNTCFTPGHLISSSRWTKACFITDDLITSSTPPKTCFTPDDSISTSTHTKDCFTQMTLFHRQHKQPRALLQMPWLICNTNKGLLYPRWIGCIVNMTKDDLI